MLTKTSFAVYQESRAKGIIHHASPQAVAGMQTIEGSVDYIKALHDKHGVDRKTRGAFMREVSPVLVTADESPNLNEQMLGRVKVYDAVARHSAKMTDILGGPAQEDFQNAWMAASNEANMIEEEVREDQAEVMPQSKHYQDER